MTDPRYDEQFRRGYEGPPVPPPVAKAQPDRESDARIPVAPVEAPTPSRPTVDEQPEVVGEVETDHEPEPLRRRNPWSIALLAGGLIFIVAGGWLLQDYVATAAINGYSPDDQLRVFVEQQLSPAFVMGGLIAVIAWLVLGAVAARPRS